MRREQLEHVLRAASQMADDPDVFVIGSQSILAAIPEDRLPREATASMEVDVVDAAVAGEVESECSGGGTHGALAWSGDLEERGQPRQVSRSGRSRNLPHGADWHGAKLVSERKRGGAGVEDDAGDEVVAETVGESA